MLEGIVALLLLALLFDFLFYKGHSQSSCQKNACNNKTSLTDKYPLFTACVCLNVFVCIFGAVLVVIFLECVWQKQSYTQNQSSPRLFQPSNDV